MHILTGGARIDCSVISQETRFYENAQRPAMRVRFSGGLTQEQLTAMLTNEWRIMEGDTEAGRHSNYTELAIHEAVFIQMDALEVENTALQGKLDTIAAVLPDDIAVDHADLYPAWAEGIAVNAGDRVQYTDVLYKVVQAHTTQADWTPDIGLSLFSRINKPDVVQAWAQGSYAKDTIVTHNGKTWISMVDNNVWEPGAEGVFDSIWKEVIV